MGARRETKRNHSALSAPDAAALAARNRGSGLAGAVRAHREDPSAEDVSLPYAWVSFQDSNPKIKAYSEDGTLFEIVLGAV